MKTRGEWLREIAGARARTEGYLTPEWTSWHAPLRSMVEMLDALDDRVRGSEVLSPEQFGDVRVGLYAVRNLDELDGGKLSLVLCRLDNSLKNRR
jgi:hypothetical protein